MSIQELTNLSLALADWRDELSWWGRATEPQLADARLRHTRYFNDTDTTTYSSDEVIR